MAPIRLPALLLAALVLAGPLAPVASAETKPTEKAEPKKLKEVEARITSA